MSKSVVVIGGGIFGVGSANHIKRALKDEVTVKLVTVTNHGHYLPAAVRLPVTNEYNDSIFPLEEVVDSDVEIICDEVIEFTDTMVNTKSGQIIDFDVLIIATGSKWPNPIGSPLEYGDDYKGHFEKESQKIKDAKHIVFVGGGFVNCEVAGEIIFKYRAEIESGEKKISIVQNLDRLLPANGFYSNKFRNYVTEWFKDNHVKLYLSSTGSQSKDDSSKLIINDGEEIEADLVYYGIGIQPSVPSHQIDGLTNSKGFIRVRKTLQAEAVTKGNIFAVGDVTNFTYHGILKRDNWVNTVSLNVFKILTEPKGSKLTEASTFENEEIPSVCSLGPDNGVGQVPVPFLGTLRLPECVAVFAKSKNLFREKSKKTFSA